MTTETFVAASYVGYVTGASTTYLTARGTATNHDFNICAVGQDITASTYNVYRSFVKFDTSTIPDDATITKVNLSLYVANDNSSTNFDVQIIEQNWADITSANREAQYDGCLSPSSFFLWKNTADISRSNRYSGADMTTSYVNKTGITRYSLRSSRDKAGNTPTGLERISLAALSTGDTYAPKLIVEYTLPPSLPSIIWW